MKINVKTLKDDYLGLKNNKATLLNLAQLKDVIRFRRKLKKAMNQLESALESLELAKSYGDKISTAKTRLKSELDALKLMKETL